MIIIFEDVIIFVIFGVERSSSHTINTPNNRSTISYHHIPKYNI